jgi:glycosyltransferase involved in cell wall biosynthesis
VCKVSVIIPTYNHGTYVLKTLDSVFAQTFTDYEVIVVNDGSPDDTAELVRPLAESDRIRYFDQPNAGQAGARNRGLAEARGDFIAFLDDDDIWPSDKLEWQVFELDRRSTCGVIAGVARELCGSDGAGRIYGKRPLGVGVNDFKEVTFEEMFKGCPFVSPGQALIRSELLRRLKGFRDSFRGTDDFDLWMRAARETQVLQSTRIALFYRVHPASASRDLQSMLVNSHKVIQANIVHVLPGSRNRLLRNAYRYLYDYCGYDLTVGCRKHLCSRHLKQFFRQVVLLTRIFLPHLYLDPVLTGKVIKGLVTNSLLRRFKRFKPFYERCDNREKRLSAKSSAVGAAFCSCHDLAPESGDKTGMIPPP